MRNLHRYERIRCDPELSFFGTVKVAEATKIKKKPGRKPSRAKAEPVPETPAAAPAEEEANSGMALFALPY